MLPGLSALVGCYEDRAPEVAIGPLNVDLDAELRNTDLGVRINSRLLSFNSTESDFNLNFNLPSAIRNFGYGLAGRVVDLIERGIEGACDLIADQAGAAAR